jgi:hypothetical protein
MKRVIILILAFASIVSGPALARDKSDVIWLSNGDRLTGEIKQLAHGLLRLKTDSLGTVGIEWNDVERIESDYEFQVERTDGTRITGIIDKMSGQQEIVLTNGAQSMAFAHENVVRMTQMENSFWERLQGSLSFGYSYTKASNVAQGNLGFAVTHRTEKRAFSLEGSTIITRDQVDESTQSSDISFSMTRFGKNRWFNTYLLGFESNDEFGLDLRTSIEAARGRFLIQTNTSEFALMGGLAGTAETLEGNVSSQKNVEGLLRADYSRFIFDNPKVDLSVGLSVYPSITDTGRTRAQFDVDLRWELFKDLFWSLGYSNTYDSDPPSGTGSTDDYHIVTSIGWSF